MKKFFIGLVAVLSLSACDEGKDSVAKIQEAYRHLIDGPISRDQLKDAQTALLGLGLVATAHKGKGSEAQAVEVSKKIIANLMKLGDHLSSESQKCIAELSPVERKMVELTDKLQKEARAAAKKYKYDSPFPLKVGDCFATDDGGEFDQVPSYRKVRMGRAEKIGDEEVLVKWLFDVSTETKVDVDWSRRLAEIGARAEQKFGLERVMKIECSRLSKVVDQFQAYAKVAGDCVDKAEDLTTISRLLK